MVTITDNFRSLMTSILFVEQYSKQPDDIPSISQIFIQDQGKQIREDKLIGKFPKWGPTFEIKFEVKLNSFPNSGPLMEIIKFTTGKGDCCLLGQRIPAVYLGNLEFLVLRVFCKYN